MKGRKLNFLCFRDSGCSDSSLFTNVVVDVTDACKPPKICDDGAQRAPLEYFTP